MKKILMFVFELFLYLAICFLSLLSPYAYEWDETLMQIDDDKLLVLRVLWMIIILIMSIVLSIKWIKKIYVFKSTKYLEYFFSFLVLAYSIYKFVLYLCI